MTTDPAYDGCTKSALVTPTGEFFYAVYRTRTATAPQEQSTPSFGGFGFSGFGTPALGRPGATSGGFRAPTPSGLRAPARGGSNTTTTSGFVSGSELRPSIPRSQPIRIPSPPIVLNDANYGDEDRTPTSPPPGGWPPTPPSPGGNTGFV